MNGAAGASSRSNSIALLRLFLASLVIFAHASPLGKFPPDILERLSNGRWNTGGLAVDGFFFLSGLLITQSYFQCASFGRFLWHRFLRIFPAFWVCLLVTAFVFAPIIYAYEIGGLNGFLPGTNAGGPFSYIWSNAFLDMHQYAIDGLLQYVPFPNAFNGSLWTLGTEFRCYLVIGLFGLVGVLTRARIVLILSFLALFVLNAFPDLFGFAGQHVPYFTSLFSIKDYLDWFVYFFIGSLTFFYRDQIGLDWKLFVLCLIAIPTVLSATYFEALLPFAVCYALYWLAYRLPIRHADRYGDFSYGVYIYAFPVQQFISFFQLNRFGFAVDVILTAVFTLPLAVLSWHLVEKPSLRLKNANFESLARLWTSARAAAGAKISS